MFGHISRCNSNNDNCHICIAKHERDIYSVLFWLRFRPFFFFWLKSAFTILFSIKACYHIFFFFHKPLFAPMDITAQLKNTLVKKWPLLQTDPRFAGSSRNYRFQRPTTYHLPLQRLGRSSLGYSNYSLVQMFRPSC